MPDIKKVIIDRDLISFKNRKQNDEVNSILKYMKNSRAELFCMTQNQSKTGLKAMLRTSVIKNYFTPEKIIHLEGLNSFLDSVLTDSRIKPEEILVIGSSYHQLKIPIKKGCIPLLITKKTRSDINDIIVTKHIGRLNHLFKLKNKKGMEQLFNLNSSDIIQKNIFLPHEKILKKLIADKKTYIFGGGIIGREIYSRIDEDGFEIINIIDNDRKRTGESFLQNKIINIEDVKDKKSVIIIASGLYIDEITNQLIQAGYTNIIPFTIYNLFSQVKLRQDLSLYDDMQKDLLINKYKYISLYLNLHDEKSRNVLEGLIKYRLTLDHSFASKVSDSSKNQYFDKKIIKLDKNEVFIDGGGFNGETTMDFFTRTKGHYKKIYFFEPDAELFNESTKNLEAMENIEFYNKGVFSKKCIMNFNSTGTMNGSFDKNGITKIQVTSLDKTIDEKISFIKLDIEGTEKEGLIGAENHIRNDNPKLAICAYHRARDFWELPELIEAINSNYKFFMRHYSPTGYETVIYAIC